MQTSLELCRSSRIHLRETVLLYLDSQAALLAIYASDRTQLVIDSLSSPLAASRQPLRVPSACSLCSCE